MPKHAFKRRKRRVLSEHAYSCALGSPSPALDGPDDVMSTGSDGSDCVQTEMDEMDAMKGKSPRLDRNEDPAVEQSPAAGLVGDMSLSEGIAASQSGEHNMEMASSLPPVPSSSSAPVVPAVGPVGNTDSPDHNISTAAVSNNSCSDLPIPGDNDDSSNSTNRNTVSGSSSPGVTTATAAATASTSTASATTGIKTSVPARHRLHFPRDSPLDTAGKFTWYMILLRQHPEAEVLFKEGRNSPYITLKPGPLSAKLTSEGFNGVVLEPMEEKQRVVLIHDVPIYINTDLLECPDGFLWVKRRYVGQTPRPQLLGVVTGEVPHAVRFTGVYGYKRVAVFHPEPDLCKRCSRWGHKEWRCRSAPRCRYCAERHASDLCYQKIQDGDKFPPKCCNCGGPHNAQSGRCPFKPRPPGMSSVHDSQLGSRTQQPQPLYEPAPPPLHNAWDAVGPAAQRYPPLQSHTRSPLASSPPLTTPTPGMGPAHTPVRDQSSADNNTLLQRVLEMVSTLAAKVDVLEARFTTLSSTLEDKLGVTPLGTTTSSSTTTQDTTRLPTTSTSGALVETTAMDCSATQRGQQDDPPQPPSQSLPISTPSVASQEILQALMGQVQALTQRVEAMALQQSATFAGLRPHNGV